MIYECENLENYIIKSVMDQQRKITLHFNKDSSLQISHWKEIYNNCDLTGKSFFYFDENVSILF